MQVTVRMTGLDVPPGLKDQQVELFGGAIVDDALIAIADSAVADIALEKLRSSSILLNNKRAYPADALHDGDKLHILRTLEGG